MLPVISKGGVTLDKVNRADKVEAPPTARSQPCKADTAVRTVTGAVTYPVTKLAGLIAGLRGRSLVVPVRARPRRGDGDGAGRRVASTIWPKKSRRPTSPSLA